MVSNIRLFQLLLALTVIVGVQFLLVVLYLSDVSFVREFFGLSEWYETTREKLTGQCAPLHAWDPQYYATLDGVRYPRVISLYQDKKINVECLNKQATIKKILFWNEFTGDKNFTFGVGVRQPFIDNNCPVTSCETHNNKSRLNESDLVIMSMMDRRWPLPADYRYGPHQRWVFVHMESPPNSISFENFTGRFNLTSTYLAGSDFPGFYVAQSDMRWQLNSSFDPHHDYLTVGKIGLAAAVISNCGAPSRRMEYIEELQKYVSVDVFGKCGRKCPTHFRHAGAGGRPADCNEIIALEYKFYLAFENSVCGEYITEKFFAMLRKPIVPIVLGGGNYDDYVPKSAYINVFDYETPKALADYLTYLSKNASAYNAYFSWKKHVQFYDESIYFASLCSMCIQLQLESFYGIRAKSIGDIDAYWKNGSSCRSTSFRMSPNESNKQSLVKTSTQ